MKKILSLTIASLILINLIKVPVEAAVFTDVNDSDWYYGNVIVLVEEGIIGGYGNGKFGPEDTMTADQFIKTMVVALGHQLENGKTYWAQPYIDKALELNIIEANEFDNYKATITRADMAMICEKVLINLEGNISYDKTQDIKSTITDLVDISSTHALPIYHMYEQGIITGYPDGEFKPNNTLKRSEACTVIRRVIDETVRNPFVVKSALEITEFSNEDKPDFKILIDISKPLESQYEDAKKYLGSKYTESVADEVILYVKEKKDPQLFLPEDYEKQADGSYSLVGKTWNIDGKRIVVKSGSSNAIISIYSW